MMKLESNAAMLVQYKLYVLKHNVSVKKMFDAEKAFTHFEVACRIEVVDTCLFHAFFFFDAC